MTDRPRLELLSPRWGERLGEVAAYPGGVDGFTEDHPVRAVVLAVGVTLAWRVVRVRARVRRWLW